MFSPSAVFISIHAPPRGATGLRRNAPTEEANFNSRPSARGDSIPGRNSAAPIIFQFTPLREGRQDWMQKKGLTRYFNSRPSARGDDAGAAEPCFLDISIHAPPRGATCSSMPGCFLPTLFQFTPLREGRRFSLSSASVPAPFQFTPLREGRRVFPIIVAFSSYFNSRPSARGDRSSSCRPSSAALYFNSRPSARGDGTRRVLGVLESYFNSRPSARGDGTRRVLGVLESYFNSRPSARGDGDGLLRAGGAGCISIHAPPRGATSRRKLLCNLWRISIHAPPRGATI